MTDDQNRPQRVRLVKTVNDWGVRVFEGERELTLVSEIRFAPSLLYVITEGKERMWPLNWVDFENEAIQVS